MAVEGTAVPAVEKKNVKNKAGTDAKGAAAGKKNVSMYKAEELVAGAEGAFGVMPECVAAALRQAGITECTKEEAARAVKAFLGRKVG